MTLKTWKTVLFKAKYLLPAAMTAGVKFLRFQIRIIPRIFDKFITASIHVYWD
jgi:hypothetical protein